MSDGLKFRNGDPHVWTSPAAVRTAAQNTDDIYEIADALDVSVEFLQESIDDFQSKKPSPWKRMLLGPDELADHSADMMIKPYSIAVAPDGRIYVTDSNNGRLLVFGADGALRTQIGRGTGQGNLGLPRGLADRILVGR